MIINHNIAALNTYRMLSANNSSASKSLEKLSSGLRINRAGDDAAGLAISEKMRGQIRGLDQATRNAQDGISLIQTAEGALNETHAILQRMRELAVQAANDTNNDNDRAEMQKEISQLISEIDRISTNTEFNTKTLLDGSLGGAGLSGALTNTVNASAVNIVNVGSLVAGDTVAITQKVTHASASSGAANDGAFEKITFTLTLGGNASGNATVEFTKAEIDGGTMSKDVTVGTGGPVFTITLNDATTLSASTGNGEGSPTSADTLTLTGGGAELIFHIGANEGQNLRLAISDMGSVALGVDGIDISTQAGADSAITTIQTAIDNVSSERAKLGAVQNRLEHTINNLGTSSENLTAAESRIRDVDMAKEMMEFTKMSILSQAAQAMLAQANQVPQGVLQLLR